MHYTPQSILVHSFRSEQAQILFFVVFKLVKVKRKMDTAHLVVDLFTLRVHQWSVILLSCVLHHYRFLLFRILLFGLHIFVS